MWPAPNVASTSPSRPGWKTVRPTVRRAEWSRQTKSPARAGPCRIRPAGSSAHGAAGDPVDVGASDADVIQLLDAHVRQLADDGPVVAIGFHPLGKEAQHGVSPKQG